MHDFAQYLMQTEHMLIVCAVWVLLALVNRCLPELADNAAWARLLPVMPIVLCSVIVWLPDVVEGSTPTRIMLGLVLGAIGVLLADPLVGFLNATGRAHQEGVIYLRILSLGTVTMRAEPNALMIPSSLFVRCRYNPFYSFMEDRVVEWLTQNLAGSGPRH